MNGVVVTCILGLGMIFGSEIKACISKGVERRRLRQLRSGLEGKVFLF